MLPSQTPRNILRPPTAVQMQGLVRPRVRPGAAPPMRPLSAREATTPRLVGVDDLNSDLVRNKIEINQRVGETKSFKGKIFDISSG
jgi:hypothetical protein